MKKIIAITLLMLAVCSTSEAAKKQIVVIETRCIAGYLFALTYNQTTSFDTRTQLVQILGTNASMSGGPGQPVKCNEKDN